jgi:5-methylcytosine-specific restriction endonuclease McrA
MVHEQSPYCAPCRRIITRGKKDHRSRARHFGVAYEPINAAGVMQRDNWMCHLCDEHIDSALRYPEQMSASLDHVIPMSKGGPHTYDNVRASHWLCNVLKSDDEAVHFRVA